MEKFKIRASAAGVLMTDPKKKSDLLAKTTKTFIHDWLKEAIYGQRKEIKSKYISKGLEFEDMAIDKSIEWLDLPFAIKNTKRYNDDFFTGEPDLLLSDRVIDIKCSYDCWTFPLFEDGLTTDDYYYQVQVYMHLTKLKKASVVYVLLNTPETPFSMEISYDNVDIKYRIKRYDFEYNPEIIEKLKERVILAREYINSIKF
jgi:hypothetical protein